MSCIACDYVHRYQNTSTQLIPPQNTHPFWFQMWTMSELTS